MDYMCYSWLVVWNPLALDPIHLMVCLVVSTLVALLLWPHLICLFVCQRHAIQALHETWRTRQEQICKGLAKEPGNRASVGRPQSLGGGGGGATGRGGRGGGERDVGRGARRAEATGEG